VPNSAYRAFDIAVEDISGDVLIVYGKFAVADTSVYYRIWMRLILVFGTIPTGLASSVINWVKLVPRTGSDDMMLSFKQRRLWPACNTMEWLRFRYNLKKYYFINSNC